MVTWQQNFLDGREVSTFSYLPHSDWLLYQKLWTNCPNAFVNSKLECDMKGMPVAIWKGLNWFNFFNWSIKFLIFSKSEHSLMINVN
jgi:hypothetical protein